MMCGTCLARTRQRSATLFLSVKCEGRCRSLLLPCASRWHTRSAEDTRYTVRVRGKSHRCTYSACCSQARRCCYHRATRRCQRTTYSQDMADTPRSCTSRCLRDKTIPLCTHNGGCAQSRRQHTSSRCRQRTAYSRRTTHTRRLARASLQCTRSASYQPPIPLSFDMEGIRTATHRTATRRTCRPDKARTHRHYLHQSCTCRARTLSTQDHTEAQHMTAQCIRCCTDTCFHCRRPVSIASCWDKALCLRQSTAVCAHESALRDSTSLQCTLRTQNQA